MKKIITYDLTDIDKVVQSIVQDCKHCAIVTLTGSLGAGKTTFAAALLRHFGVQDPVVSPTFTYVNMYHLADGRAVYHFDLYRLQSIQEFEQLGFFEYLYQPDSLVLIEWPGIVLPVLKNNVCHMRIDGVDQTKRTLQYELV